jgi:voltage-gated potassium channel Kch
MNTPATDSTNTPSSGQETDLRPIIVAGLGRLGLSIVLLLRSRGLTVKVITEAGSPNWHIRTAREHGAELFLGDFRDPEIWASAGAAEAQAAAITSADDSRNLETSIRIKRLAPQLRLVTRVDAPHLGHRLQSDFALHAALCPAALCATQFVTAALDASASSQPSPRPARRESRRRASWQLYVIGLLTFCLVTGTLVFHYTKDIPWMTATYFTMTILTTVGFGDINLHQDPPWLQAFGMFLMLAGVTLIALLVSLFSHFLITGEASRNQHQRAARRLKDHVIIAGMGTLGLAVLKQFQERGIPAVCVEMDRSRVDAIPAGSTPIIEGDATGAETLLRAGIDRARAVLAVTSADGTNLEIALRARSLTDHRDPKSPLPVIISCQDELLAARLLAADSAYLPLSSADLAAPVFVSAALGR